MTRTAISGAPSPTSNYGLKITTNGTASPGLGGFYLGNQSAANKIYTVKIIAKIPKGYTIQWGGNATGTGRRTNWLTSQSGTGNWQEYMVQLVCGAYGTFSTTSFCYLNGNVATTANPVTWYVSYVEVVETASLGSSRNIIVQGKDDKSGIVAYGINQSSTQQPTYTTYQGRQQITMILNKITNDGNYYVWLKDKAGNVKVSLVEAIKIEESLFFTQSYIQSGSFTGGNYGTWGTASLGFAIKGRAPNAALDGTEKFSVNTLMRWSKTIDLTKYNTLEFNIMKYVDHGLARIYLGEQLIFSKNYDGLPLQSWVSQKIDISGYKGKQVVSFVGGYVDVSGNVNSTTYFSDIRMYK